MRKDLIKDKVIILGLVMFVLIVLTEIAFVINGKIDFLVVTLTFIFALILVIYLAKIGKIEISGELGGGLPI